ncbi:hypothetical protein A3D83_00195 [Candidatus Daviesbacteria bacterium RIFCSPHIGHO2_02_FULL_41_10]|uniref:Glycosyltransferase RgtA/B/C/D-like domain-containing protein n=2 Tax=Candidatus Daviesiibacteriota TaxID=1752718 RepID=A0A1F5IRP7_9BACT|nr:MAG: hypothetical protein A2871_01625 [Candidatus Daviesbacteria bacterium RIFCSPHIGHO2_01_FULL_41_23]OGE33745.1 MAG: hypothetical protein A3D83_00195 [Candidatus Daviesbacteria bacterium RIFCSPHIGHO2_02_FULL_41_10]OGE62165.1 MAG: hypothetical protein A2967_00720 [Candidatus Daviesbacteria bacterium RIFCSPLOWO2_01_FULL_41_32]
MKKIFILILLIRIFLSLLPSYEVDLRGWRFWSDRMTTLGPANFYSREIFTDNPPGFLYVFWTIGEIQKNFLPEVQYGSVLSDLLLKFPSNLADLLTGFIIYLIIKKHKNQKTALTGFLLYTLNPAIFFNSSIMGQFDGSAALFSLLSVYFLIKNNRSPELSALSFAISWAIKPQSIVLVPLLILLTLTSQKPLRWLTAGFTFLISSLIIYFPFFPQNPLYGLYYVNHAMTGIFTCTSCFTFNFWGIFGNWKDDLINFFNLPLLYWGFILTALSFIPIFLFKPFLKRFREPFIYFTAAVSIMASFTFLTRMHERYIFPFFAFFLIAALLIKSRKLILFYIIYSAFNLLNLYFPYAYYNTELKLTPIFIDHLFRNFSFLSILGFVLFLILLVTYLKVINTRKE